MCNLKITHTHTHAPRDNTHLRVPPGELSRPRHGIAREHRLQRLLLIPLKSGQIHIHTVTATQGTTRVEPPVVSRTQDVQRKEGGSEVVGQRLARPCILSTPRHRFAFVPRAVFFSFFPSPPRSPRATPRTAINLAGGGGSAKEHTPFERTQHICYANK